METYTLGALPSPKDERDFQLPIDQAFVLPKRYLANPMPPALNQGKLPQCVAYSAAGMKMWQEMRDGDTGVDFSEQWLYDQSQAIDGVPMPHEGTTCRAAQTIMYKKGFAVTGKPGTEAKFKTKAYYAVPLTYAAIKAAIHAYGPVQIASAWYDNWYKPGRNGLLAPPVGAPVGGHATLAFGWDDDYAGGSLVVRNSWGPKWGNGFGNFWAPSSFFIRELHDAWKALDVRGD